METDTHKDRTDFAEKIQGMLGLIQNNLQNHGAAVELLEVKENRDIKMRLKIQSSNCPQAEQVAQSGVENLMRMRVPELNQVIFD